MNHFVKKLPLASPSLYLAGERFNGHYDPTNRCGAELRNRGGYKVKWRRDSSQVIITVFIISRVYFSQRCQLQLEKREKNVTQQEISTLLAYRRMITVNQRAVRKRITTLLFALQHG